MSWKTSTSLAIVLFQVITLLGSEPRYPVVLELSQLWGTEIIVQLLRLALFIKGISMPYPSEDMIKVFGRYLSKKWS